MNIQTPQHAVATAPNHALQIAFQMLSKAWRYAVEANVDPWQFAIEISDFQHFGVTKSDLRWLVINSYALHAEEITSLRATQRCFKALNNTRLPNTSCFILSDLGTAVVKPPIPTQQKSVKAAIVITHGAEAKSPIHDEKASPSILMPHWNQTLKVLKIGEQIVKRFRNPSPIQELIITAFQEAGWPARIDDPLPQTAEQESKRRLNNAIRCLNRNQAQKLIHFRGDGSGTGITWEVCPSKST